MREACGGCVSSAQHRSDSAARSTPTRSAAKGHAPKILHKTTSLKINKK
ncbi:MAG: hypothetical protein RML94_02695 [Bacteroidia bacterium]|nr:hypothetical protein [Bacteroidia bacterium]